MTERSRPLSLLVAAAAMLVIVVSAGLVAERARASAVEGPCLSLCEPPTEVENPDPVHSMLVLNVGWDTGVPATSSPLVERDRESTVALIRSGVNEWFRRSAPAGAFQPWQVAPGASYAIAPPKTLTATTCTEGNKDQVLAELIERADAAARAHGIDPSAYGVVIYLWDREICPFSGITDALGGRRIGIQFRSADVIEHELGHHLGLPHANLVRCTNGGTQVPLSGTCTSEEYGDPYDTMGSGLGLFNAMYENDLGWLNNQVVNVSAGDFTQSWTLKPLSEPSQSPRALRLVDGSTTLWLEYRQPTGLDSPTLTGGSDLSFGLLVHREAPNSGSLSTSQLLDMSPSTSFADPVLPVGQTWADPLGTMKITLDSADASGATVTISSQRVSVPDLGRRTLASAKSAIQAAGLTFAGSSVVRDPSCTSINKVVSQSPSAGTRVLPGTSVSVAVGQRDPEHECL